MSLYNAVNGSSYDNPDDIKFTTIEDVVYMKMKNDVSFLVSGEMNFYEQQSTFNPNMPMRFFIYAGMVYAKYVENSRNYHRYSSELQKAPTPKCICFYNGSANKEERTVLKLSDAFDSESDIEVKVTMINVNYGYNKELLKACKPLEEYAYFIERIRYHQNNSETLEESVDKSLDDLSDDSVIKPFLILNKAEVKRMCITEYDEARTLSEAREEGIVSAFASLVKDGILSISEAARRADMTESEFKLKAGLNS